MSTTPASQPAAQTNQERMVSLMQQVGLPYREIKCYGSQITVECTSRKTIARWLPVVRKVATIKGVAEVWVEKKAKAGYLQTSHTKAFRLYAVIEVQE